MATQMDSPQPVESFIKLFEMISKDPSYSLLQTLVEENERLRVSSANLKTAYNENFWTVANLQQDLQKELGRTAKKAAELESVENTANELKNEIEQANITLKKKESELAGTAEGISKMQGLLKDKQAEVDQLREALKGEKSDAEEARVAKHEAEEQTKALEAELKRNKARLEKLDGFVTKLHPQPPDAIREQLGTIFKSSLSLMRSFLGIDLPENILSDSSKWNEIRNHLTVTRAIPVPSTNSPAAKQMRVAASLAILASSLTTHVFQPTYLLGDNELATLLNELSSTEFEKEAHLRSALLPLFPHKQMEHAAERAQKATSDLVKCVSSLILPSKRDEFASALLQICQNASRYWTEIQRLADRVEPVVSFDIVSEADDWKLIQFPGMDARQGSSSGHKEGSVQSKPEDMLCSGTENVVSIVWPAFVLFDDEQQEVLNEGFVLENFQVEDARVEESSGFGTGNRRMTRHNSRRNAVQNESEATEKKGFLSNGAGGPSGGD
ncbi:MEI5 protein [Colletotrichum tofieldiae]|nr:MEI5 protein [Colletotrichum tofieldiae]